MRDFVKKRKYYFLTMLAIGMVMTLQGYFLWWDFFEVSHLLLIAFVIGSHQRITTTIHLVGWHNAAIQEWVFCVVIPMAGIVAGLYGGALLRVWLS